MIYVIIHTPMHLPNPCHSVAQSCPTLCNPMNCSMPGFPVLHYLYELAQTHVHRVGDVIQPSHPLSPPSAPAFNLSQHQGLFQWVCKLHVYLKTQNPSMCQGLFPNLLCLFIHFILIILWPHGVSAINTLFLKRNRLVKSLTQGVQLIHSRVPISTLAPGCRV